jgi:hypothetical protein
MCAWYVDAVDDCAFTVIALSTIDQYEDVDDTDPNRQAI